MYIWLNILVLSLWVALLFADTFFVGAGMSSSEVASFTTLALVVGFRARGGFFKADLALAGRSRFSGWLILILVIADSETVVTRSIGRNVITGYRYKGGI